MTIRIRTAAVVAMAVLAAACSPASSPPASTTSVPMPASSAPSSSTTTDAPTTTTTPPTTVAPPEPADTVWTNGRIITLDADSTVAEALAIADGEIVAVGSDDAIDDFVGPSTTTVDLEGRSVVPGFIDPHTHALQVLAYLADLDGMRLAQEDLLAGGVTTIGSPNVKPDDLAGFEAFADAGMAIVRDHLYLTVNDECGERPFDDYAFEHEFSHDPDLRQTVAGVKMFTDGGVCNAPALSIPYPDTVPQRLKDAGWVGKGSLYVTADEIAETVTRADQAGGITVIHAIGDRGIRAALDGLTQAAAGGPFDNPQRIDHNSTTSLLDDSELARYGELGMVPALFPVPYANGCDPTTVDLWRAILPRPVLEVIENSRALRAANPGLRVAWHGDAPSLPGHPLQLMFTVVSGKAVDIDTGDVCAPEGWSGFFTVPAEEALRMLTINAAAAMGIDGRLGSIEVGKIADLVVLANDPLDPDPEIGFARNRPLATFIDGEGVFCDGDGCEQFGAQAAGSPPSTGGPVGTDVTVTASSFRDVHTPDLVLDGSTDGDAFCSSGQDPPGWIQVTFADPTRLAGLRLVVFQNPPSDTVHVLEVRSDGKWREVTTFRGFTTTGDVLTWMPDEPLDGIEAFRVTTLESASWPEWYEIEISTAADL